MAKGYSISFDSGRKGTFLKYELVSIPEVHCQARNWKPVCTVPLRAVECAGGLLPISWLPQDHQHMGDLSSAKRNKKSDKNSNSPCRAQPSTQNVLEAHNKSGHLCCLYPRSCGRCFTLLARLIHTCSQLVDNIPIL